MSSNAQAEAFALSPTTTHMVRTLINVEGMSALVRENEELKLRLEQAEEGGRILHRAQVRATFTKNARFIKAHFVPYLRLSWLAKAAQVCKAWRKVCYNPDITAACILKGGVDDADRPKFWLSQVGMATGTSSGAGEIDLLDPIQVPSNTRKYGLGILTALAEAPPQGRDQLYISIHSADCGLVSPLPTSINRVTSVSSTQSTELLSPPGPDTYASPTNSSTNNNVSMSASKANGVMNTTPTSTAARTRGGGLQAAKKAWLRKLEELSSFADQMVQPDANPQPRMSPHASGEYHYKPRASIGTAESSDMADWAEGTKRRVERVPGLYEALLHSADVTDNHDISGVRGPKRNSFLDIDKDVSRTANFTNRKALRNVLRCLTTFLPASVGYVQGQNMIARFMLRVMNENEEDAFWACVGMMHRFDLLGLYTPGMPRLRLRFFQLDRLVLWHLPELHTHFESCDVRADLYATSWFITILSDLTVCPEGDVRVVWDRLFLYCDAPGEQWSVVYAVILETLLRAEPHLLMLPRFDNLIQRLTKLPMAQLRPMEESMIKLLSDAATHFEPNVPLACQLLMLEDEWRQAEDQMKNQR